jgi:hypothetical protein
MAGVNNNALFYVHGRSMGGAVRWCSARNAAADGRLCDLIIADMQVLAIRRGTANRPHHRASYSIAACQWKTEYASVTTSQTGVMSHI